MLRRPKSLAAGCLGRVRPGLGAVLALLALVLVFLAGLFGEEGRWRLSSAGALAANELTRVDPPARALGRADPAAALRSEPWAAFDRREFREGRAPLWNPWSGAGRPHLANAGTASFSPFAVAGYLFEPRTAALESAALELFALALFAYLLLREIECSVLAALVGATAFAFAGSQLHPLATARAGALAALPAALLFTEKALRSVDRVVLGAEGERRSTARLRAPLAGLCLTFAIGALCGSPAALALSATIALSWAFARGSAIAIAARAQKLDLRPLRVAAFKAAVAFLVAVGMVSFRLLGWFELWARSDAGTPVSGLPASPSLGPWPLHVFPSALGEVAADAIAPVHVGGIVLFLALLALPFSRRDPRIGWFAALGLLCLAATTGAAPVLGKLAAFGVPSDEVGQGGWALSVACVGALGVDRISLLGQVRPWSRATLLALAAILFLAVFRLGLEHLADFDPASAAPHLRRTAEAFAAGIVAVCLLGVAKGAKARLLAGAGLVIATFLGGGRALADSIPRCEERVAFAWTPSLSALRARVGSDRIVVVGEDALPADANVAYEIATLPSRGGMEVDAFARLYLQSFSDPDLRGPMPEVSERALQTFGVRWVLAREPFELARAKPSAFERTDVLGGLALYRYKRSLGKAWVVGRSTRATSLERALAFVADEAFDPSRVVVLGPDEDEKEPPGSPPPERLEEALGARVADLPRPDDPPPRWTDVAPTWVRIEAECDSPQFLVLAQTRYPGWRARVNGVETPLLRANAAFAAVELPPGVSVVELSYEPRSLEIGLWIAIASALVGLACLFHRRFA